MNEAEAEFLELFRHEANERLDSMVSVLRGRESGEAVREALDALFREAHTIRGGAGMLGLDDASTLAHAIEDALDSARNAGELPLRLVDPLLRASNALRSQVAGEEEGATGLLEELAGPW